MDSILLIPPTKTIPPQGLRALETFITDNEYGNDWDENSVTLNGNKPTRLFSREGNYEVEQEGLKLAEKHGFALGIQTDGNGEEDTYEWDDISHLAWFSPERGSGSSAAGALTASPKFSVEVISAALRSHEGLTKLQGDIQTLREIGATNTELPESFKIPLKEFNPDQPEKGHQAADREAEICASTEGIRICLNSKGKKADIYLEARPNGWHILAHPDPESEPEAKIHIPDSGNIQATQI